LPLLFHTQTGGGGAHLMHRSIIFLPIVKIEKYSQMLKHSAGCGV
jgi:hypothetical protein